jgi:NAD(P)H-dependent FMN reductase
MRQQEQLVGIFQRLNIALIIGSTRPNRFAEAPARWLRDGAHSRRDIALEILDLRDWALPFLEEPKPPSQTGGVFANPIAEQWRRKIGEFDGFILLTAEYNHGAPAVLKNALDSALNEWRDKPVSFVGYGGVGGARAVEQLRLNAIELRMAPLRDAVHIGLEPFLAVSSRMKSLDDYDYLVQARTAMFDQLAWWARALVNARTALPEGRLKADEKVVGAVA